ncbi:6-bladed beta-propeller [Parabacteroides sp. OttesenSCG-928-G07]|nr:6-bladed beta-propeller [Parabacteroides sp. OttesenSCG-928-G21]MDL2278288.1 6-bladed beta-propeller [Parabacteroides sp. OttesenSCG-928-G07]
MKREIALMFLILFVLAGCGGNQQSTDDLITVDVTASYPKKELILQDVFDVEYIPLETTDEFVNSGYVQAIGKDVIIVRNSRGADGNIFIYDRKGKALRKINRRGQGPEEYTNVTGEITFDEESGEMYINCYGLKKILVYDLFGNFKRSLGYVEGGEESGRFKTDIGYKPLYNFDQDHLIGHDWTSGRNFAGREIDVEPRNIIGIISKQDGSLIKEIEIPFEKKVFQVVFPPTSGGVYGIIYNSGLVPYHDSWILTEPSADTIYSYTADHKMKPFIVRTPSVQSMNPETFLFPGVLTDRYYFMQTVKKEIDETEPRSNLLETELVYDRQEKKTFEYIIYNDDFTSKRPINNLVDDIFILTVINNDEIAFAEKIEAYDLVEAYKNGQLSGRLKEIAANLDEEDNPVIMLAKHKK